VDIGEGDHFSYFLKLLASLQDGSIALESFEEQMRELFTTEAYMGFTLDKLIAHVAKRVHKCGWLFLWGVLGGFLYELTRRVAGRLVTDETSKRLVAAYLGSGCTNEAEYLARAAALINDAESVYRVEQPRARHVVLELLDPAQGAGAETATDKWMRYIDQYVLMDHDPALAELSRQPVFLARSKRAAGFPDDGSAMRDVSLANHLECKICVNTYKMFFVTHSEDFFHRAQTHDAETVGGFSVVFWFFVCLFFGHLWWIACFVHLQAAYSSSARHARFVAVERKWLDAHVTATDAQACEDWLAGTESSGLTKGKKPDDLSFLFPLIHVVVAMTVTVQPGDDGKPAVRTFRLAATTTA
jgi:hypothetical protein